MKAVKYDEIVKELGELEVELKPGGITFIDKSQVKSFTPMNSMNCSTCLWDNKDQKCNMGHIRLLEETPGVVRRTLPISGCLGWEVDLTGREMERAEKEFQNAIGPMEALETAKKYLKDEYPHGHPKFLDLILDEIRLHSDKNHDFAKGGNPLGNFNRVGAILDLYPGLGPGDPVVVAVSFMLKQLDASLWMLSQGYTAKVEGHTERWRDIAIYAKIISILIEEDERWKAPF